MESKVNRQILEENLDLRRIYNNNNSENKINKYSSFISNDSGIINFLQYKNIENDNQINPLEDNETIIIHYYKKTLSIKEILDKEDIQLCNNLSTTSNSYNYSNTLKHTHINALDVRGVIKNTKNLRKDKSQLCQLKMNNLTTLEYMVEFKKSNMFKNNKILFNIFKEKNKNSEINNLKFLTKIGKLDNTEIIKENKSIRYDEAIGTDDEDDEINNIKDFHSKYLIKERGDTINLIKITHEMNYDLKINKPNIKNKFSQKQFTQYNTYSPNTNNINTILMENKKKKETEKKHLISLISYIMKKS